MKGNLDFGQMLCVCVINSVPKGGSDCKDAATKVCFTSMELAIEAGAKMPRCRLVVVIDIETKFKNYEAASPAMLTKKFKFTGKFPYSVRGPM